MCKPDSNTQSQQDLVRHFCEGVDSSRIRFGLQGSFSSNSPSVHSPHLWSQFRESDWPLVLDQWCWWSTPCTLAYAYFDVDILAKRALGWAVWVSNKKYRGGTSDATTSSSLINHCYQCHCCCCSFEVSLKKRDFPHSKITRDRRMDGPTDRRTDGHDLI